MSHHIVKKQTRYVSIEHPLQMTIALLKVHKQYMACDIAVHLSEEDSII